MYIKKKEERKRRMTKKRTRKDRRRMTKKRMRKDRRRRKGRVGGGSAR